MNLKEQMAQVVADGKKAVNDGDLEKARELHEQAEALQERIDLAGKFGAYEPEPKKAVRPPLPMDADPEPDEGESDADKLNKAVNILRFGEDDDPTSVVMREVYGGDYRQMAADATKSFATFIRTGRVESGAGRQMWNIKDVKSMLESGMSVAEIKATMVEGQDTLGGFAIPPNMSGNVISRLPGLTAVRGGGATIVQTASNSIQWLKRTGGGDQYIGNITGAWGAETQSPSAKNATLGLERINVDTYTYKVALSASLIEDATNIVQLVQDEVVVALAIDEDTAFLTGDGANKPRGILPGEANSHSLTEVVSGEAAALAWSGLRKLRRGVAAQYRARAKWIGNSDTAGDIEDFVDNDNRHYIDFVDVGQPLLRHEWRESESMPDVAANAYPIIFGDLTGYYIVERLGLAVARYNDSNTGINVVELHVRRRIGGDLVEPWKFAVQKVAAS